MSRYKLHEFNKLAERSIFIDANVIIYLFWPTGQHNFEMSYAKVFKNFLVQKNKLFVDIFIISEIINRILRIEHQKISSTQNFKDFRNSEVGKNALNDIHIILKDNILKVIDIASKGYSQKEIESFFNIEDIDFVDKATTLLCKENDMVLLTNDGDFKNSAIEIISGNPKLV
ncbi:PIN domain-containing protein [Moheibacter lacus]|nr:PIN domain-containing protein [Moheibacter lacus]